MRKGKRELEKARGTAVDESKMIWEIGEGTDLVNLVKVDICKSKNGCRGKQRLFPNPSCQNQEVTKWADCVY